MILDTLNKICIINLKIIIFFIIVYIFSSCKKDDSEIESNSSSNSSCGSVNITIDGVSKVYNPLTTMCSIGNTVQVVNGEINAITIMIQSICSNNTANDYIVSYSSLGEDYSFYEARAQIFDCSTMPNSSYYIDGTISFSNIDYTNKKMSGSFSLLGNNMGKPTVNCTFTNLPFTLNSFN